MVNKIQDNLLYNGQVYINKSVIKASYFVLIFLVCVMIIYPVLVIPIIKVGSNDLLVVMINECLVLAPIIMVYRIIQKQRPIYPFQIYENGFIFPTKINGANMDTNYIKFDQIEKVAFITYGTKLLVKIKAAGISEITPKWSFESYYLLSRTICKKTNQSHCPDFDLLEKMSIMLRDGKPIDIIKQLVQEKNKEFVYVPDNFR